jgi:hypothetical protein
MQTVGLAELAAIEADPASGGNFGGPRAGEPEQTRECGIDSFADKPIGDGQGSQSHQC